MTAICASGGGRQHLHRGAGWCMDQYGGAGSRKRRMLGSARFIWRLKGGEPPAIQGSPWAPVSSAYGGAVAPQHRQRHHS